MAKSFWRALVRLGIAFAAMNETRHETMTRTRGVRRIGKPAGAALCAIAIACWIVPAGAASPLTPQQRQELRQALEKLVVARAAMASMVSECNGGAIMVFACPAPAARRAPSDTACAEPLAPCGLVAALRETDQAIDHLRGALAQR
jgi:hypothetical protein